MSGGPHRRPRGRLPSWPGGALAAAALAVTGQSFAQTGDAALSGHASLGVRSVDVGGAATKYKEDVNLDDGVRLFDAAISYAPDPGSSPAIDRLDLDVGNLGDPFETVRLDVRKHGRYRLELNRRRSEYFYEDVIVPRPLASVEGVTGGDFHGFDFERIQDELTADVTLTPATKLRFDLERYTREGDSTTTRDVQRDEFELDRPIDETMDSFSAGIQHAWSNVTLVFEEQVREFENTTEIFLPGASAGLNPDDPAELGFFLNGQSYDYQSLAHLMHVVARPTPRLDVRAAWRLENLDLDMDAFEDIEGTDFAGNPFTTGADGTADVDRDVSLQELGFGFGVSERLRVTANLRRQELEQRGALSFGGESGRGAWDIETTGAEAGIELMTGQRLLWSVGVSSESREAENTSVLAQTTHGEREQTDRNGFFARLTFDGDGGLQIVAGIEDDDIDDPYALASPDRSRRYLLRGRHRWDNGLSLSASLRSDDVENESSGWSAATTQTNVRLAYDTDALRLALSLARVDLGRSIDQLVTGGFRQELFAIDYDADARFADVEARWQASARFAVGGSVRLYENKGSFALERDDVRAFVEIDLTGDYALLIATRSLDYTEDVFDDYDAEIVEVGFRTGW